jgi:hypothetical protein
MYGTILAVVAIITIFTVVITKWYLAKGILRPVYYLNITTAILHASVNWIMYLHDSEQIAILLYNLLSIYAIVMSIKGLKRLKKEEPL